MAWKGGCLKVVCRHGHFAFYPNLPRDIARFARFFDQDLVSVEDFFTFEPLAELPRYSLVVKPFGNLPAIVTYEGRNAWDVMRENSFVYDLTLKILVPKVSIISIMELPRSDSYFISPAPLVQPGTLDKLGNRFMSYQGEFFQDSFQLKISAVSNE